MQFPAVVVALYKRAPILIPFLGWAVWKPSPITSFGSLLAALIPTVKDPLEDPFRVRALALEGAVFVPSAGNAFRLIVADRTLEGQLSSGRPFPQHSVGHARDILEFEFHFAARVPFRALPVLGTVYEGLEVSPKPVRVIADGLTMSHAPAVPDLRLREVESAI
jgi:hypothetical protein